MKSFRLWLASWLLGFPRNSYHPLVWIHGKPEIGQNVYIGAFSVVNAKGASVTIGSHSDIASFVSINCADSHKRTIGLTDPISRKAIFVGRNVFIGSHSVIKGGAEIGDFSVIAAGTVVDGKKIPPYSLVSGNPMRVKSGFYAQHRNSS